MSAEGAWHSDGISTFPQVVMQRPLRVARWWPTPLRPWAVTDGSSVAPAIRHVEDRQIGGRGLRIIEAITWGYDPHPLGKHVWAELESRQPDGNPRSPASDPED
jgi:hypothetical protein